MNGFDYVRTANQYFVPRTPRAAIKALEEGLLPAVAFIYKANSVGPLDEEPFDFDDIERVLARRENDLATNLQLMSIFERLLKHRDPEIALFAAESINAVENRYNTEIESLRRRLAEATEAMDDRAAAEARRGIARQFYEVARINDSRPAIKRFYLVEAYGNLKDLYRASRFTKADLTLAVEVLVSLGSPDRARYILERVTGEAKDDPDILFLLASVEFSARRFDRVAAAIERVRAVAPWVRADQQELVRMWSEPGRE